MKTEFEQDQKVTKEKVLELTTIQESDLNMDDVNCVNESECESINSEDIDKTLVYQRVCKIIFSYVPYLVEVRGNNK